MRMVKITQILTASVEKISMVLLSLIVTACQVDNSAATSTVNQAEEEKVQISEGINQPATGKWCYTMQTPDSNWSLKLDSIHQLESGRYIALGLLRRNKGSGLQVISQLTMCAPLNIDAKNISVYIKGKTWGWSNKETAKFVKAWPTLRENSTMVYKFDPSLPPIKPTPNGNPDR